MSSSWQKPGLLPWNMVAIFLLLAAGVGTAGYFYYEDQLAREKLARQHDLAAIASLKTQQITEWRKERIAEAKSILATSFMPPIADKWLAGGRRDDNLRDTLLAWMAAPRHTRHYSRIYLLDTQGKVMLSYPDDGARPDAHTIASMREALRRKSVTLQDFHYSVDGKTLHLDLCVPLAVSHHSAPSGEIGALVFEIDPYRFLYPLIQAWPTPSPSAETLLVRRDGDKVTFLNELRHRRQTAATLSIPLSQTQLLAAKVALGQEGIVEGLDYRSKPVVGATTRIKDSPWMLVAKMDKEEFYAPIHQRAKLLALLVATLIGGAAVTIIFLWRQQQLRFNLARHEFEEEVLHKANVKLEARVAERTRDLQAEIELHHITERVLKESMDELSHSNADLEQFAYIASHDLQEPLRMVASFVQLLERRYRDELDQDAHDFIDYAVEGITRMQRLINDQLAYALVGIDSGQPEPTDCNQVLAEVLMNLKPLIEENHALITQDILPIVPAIHSQIGQLLQNLIGNAIKFHSAKTPEIHISSRHEENTWIFSVRDNGIGIAPEYFDKIFLVFKRLHSREKYPGNGIGLAICKRIVERHHGRIWVESELGKGTTVYFTIPTTLERQQPTS
ncbi:MAG: GHKL domain-containing protein [Betaproteobacteria bacterium]|nr:GHKL domain-containing protein [Betaproteobacteria bacterium]